MLTRTRRLFCGEGIRHCSGCLLKGLKGASIYNAGCANKAITCNLPDGEKKEELQKKLDAVYTQLGDGTIQPMAAAPGADVRKTFASNCLTLHYWILQSVKVSK